MVAVPYLAGRFIALPERCGYQEIARSAKLLLRNSNNWVAAPLLTGRIFKGKTMTALLTEAFQKASILPKETQDQLAQEMITEIEWENRWKKSLSESGGKLDLLAENALHEYMSGKTQEMGFDEL